MAADAEGAHAVKTTPKIWVRAAARDRLQRLAEEGEMAPQGVFRCLGPIALISEILERVAAPS